MRVKIILKILVVVIILLPLVSYLGCKKQPKCGCEGDVLFTLDSALFDYSDFYYIDSTSCTFRTDMYTTYLFCNPVEMYPAFEALSGNSQILLSGEVFWECNYVMSSGSSSSYYYNYYKVYQIKVTGMVSGLYGK